MRLEDVIQVGDRASQPAANTVPIGCLYCVNDENYILERSDGASWGAYSPGSADGTIAVLSADPGSPADGTAWIVATGVSPTRTVSWKFRDGGVTYTLVSVTF